MKTHLGHARDSRRGGALILSVSAVLVVSILAAGFLQLCTAISRRMSASADTTQALYLAEAGLAEAYSGLAQAKTGNVGTEERPAAYGGGLFWVEAIPHAGGLVELESTALYGTGRATLGMVCEPVNIGVASLGFFTDKDLRLNPDVRLDSYDSKQGTYADQMGTPLNNQGIVGSNGNVTVASGNLIFGDVIYGPTAGAKVSAGSVVTGDMSPRADLETLPPIDVPAIPLLPGISYSGAAPLIIPPGEAGYKSLDITKNCKVILKGPLTLVVEDIILRSGAELRFDTTDGPVELHVTSSLDLNTGSIVSTSTQVTSDSIVMVSAPPGKTVNFGAKSQFYGFIYAPYAQTHVSSTYEVYGGLICSELRLAAQGKLHFDLALGPTLESLLPTLWSWRVVDIPTNVSANRMDPFWVLGLDPKDLPKPSEAHADQVLDIRYIDHNGNRDSYFGLESEFDWSQVKELIYGTRDGIAFYLPDDYVAPANDPNVDLVNSGMTSKELKDALLAASPISDDALIAAAGREPPMTSPDLKAVLDKQGTLSDPVLLAAVDSDSLSSSDLKNVLIDNSPLSPEVLSAVLARNPPLSLSDLTSLLSKQ